MDESMDNLKIITLVKHAVYVVHMHQRWWPGNKNYENNNNKTNKKLDKKLLRISKKDK